MRGNNSKYKLIKRTPQSLLKGSTKKNISATYKKSLASPKKKNFSISSNEEFSSLKLKKMFLNKEKKIEGSFHKDSQRLSRVSLSNNKSKQNLSQKLFRYSIKNGKNANLLENKQKNKVESLFKKNKFKKTIIIDGEGNNNLNLNKLKTYHTSQKLHLLNVKGKTKKPITKVTAKFEKIKNYRTKTISQKEFLFSPKNKDKDKKKNIIKQIAQIRNAKRCLSSKNDAIRNLINIYKNDHFDTISSTFTETNSLFVKSNNSDEKKMSFNNYLNLEEISENKYNFDKKDENKIINEYNKKKHLKINEISDYTTFFNDLQKNEIKNNMDDNNKENITNNNSIELISFMESSIQDDIYQSLLKNNSKEINQKEDSFNLSQSISEFDKAVKRKKNYEFENIIHLPMKNNNQSENIHILDKIENQNTKENLSKIQKSDENKKDENENHLCIIF